MIGTYLSFEVCEELMAINVKRVLEVLRKQIITEVPNEPAQVRGIINFRGEIVPVFDLRTSFNMPVADADSKYMIMVLDLSDQHEIFRVGALVDKVKDVIEIDESAIKEVPRMSKDFNTEFIQGVYKLKEEFIIVLNVEKVFSDSEMRELKTINMTGEEIEPN